MNVCNPMRIGLWATTLAFTSLSAQAALVPVFEYEFPLSYNGSTNVVTDVSGAGNNGIATGHPLTLSNNVPAGFAPGSQSIDFVAKAGRINTSSIDLLTSAAVAVAGGFTYEVNFNATGVNTGGFRKIIDNAGTEYLGYDGNTNQLVLSVGNAGFNFNPAFSIASAGGWNHVVLEFDTNGNPLVGGSVTGDLKLIVNGVSYFAGTRTMTNFGDTLNRSISVGQHPLGGEQFNGLIASAKVSLGTEAIKLQGHWKLDETTGSTAFDASGNGNHGNVQGGPGLGIPSANETVGKGYDFDGVNDQINVGNADLFKMQNDFTIMAWIKPDKLTGVQRIFSQDAPAGYGFGLSGEGFRFTTYGVQDYNLAVPDLEVGIFQHVAVVFDSQNDAHFYLNGVFVGTVLGASVANLSDLNFFIGSAGGSEFFDGVIDDVRFYRGTLTQAQIVEIIAIPEPTTLALVGLVGVMGLARRRRIA